MTAFSVIIYDVPSGTDISKFHIAGHKLLASTPHKLNNIRLTVEGSSNDEELEVSHPEYDVMGVDVYII